MLDTPLHLSEAEAFRFWQHVQPSENGCWIWCGGKQPYGYGQLFINKRTTTAHRLAYALTVGAIPKRMVVMHLCDNPPCVNPAHLRLGTYAENRRDSAEKGRGTGGVNGIAVSPSTEWYCCRGHLRDAPWKRCEPCKVLTTGIGAIRRGAARPAPLGIRDARIGVARNATGFIGVRVTNGRYQATVHTGGKHYHAGAFDDATSAARAHDVLALRLLGGRARLNFPVEELLAIA